MIRLLEPDELCSELLAVEVIGHLQCEHIRSQTTRVDKNNELVDVLVRRSYADLRQFVSTLQATGQRHVADVLVSGGGRSVLYSIGAHNASKMRFVALNLKKNWQLYFACETSFVSRSLITYGCKN